MSRNITDDFIRDVQKAKKDVRRTLMLRDKKVRAEKKSRKNTG